MNLEKALCHLFIYLFCMWQETSGLFMDLFLPSLNQHSGACRQEQAQREDEWIRGCCRAPHCVKLCFRPAKILWVFLSKPRSLLAPQINSQEQMHELQQKYSHYTQGLFRALSSWRVWFGFLPFSKETDFVVCWNTGKNCKSHNVSSGQ